MSRKGILVQAHRGCPSKFPENSIKSFEAATELDVAAIELDIACSQDGVIVVSHDPFINKDLALNLDGDLFSENDHFGFNKLSYDHIAQFRFGERPHHSFIEQRPHSHTLPTLDDVLEWHSEKEIWLNIEIKYDSRHSNDLVALDFFMQRLAQVVRKMNPQRVVLQSFSLEALKIIDSFDLGVPMFFLAYDDSWKGKIQMLDFIDGLGLLYKIIDQQTIQIAKDNHWSVAAWTVNDERNWKELHALGVDSIISDHPEKLLDWMKLNQIESLKGLA